MLKAVILIGGNQKGTRFRPLSLDVPKPLFPIAGRPMIQHHIEACVQMKEVKEILIIGFYNASQMEIFVAEMQELYEINIRYLQEFTALGTAGGMYHFRDLIRLGASAFFVLNGDVCADFPLQQLYDFHKSKKDQSLITIMSTEATKQQSLHYGCLVLDKISGVVDHYVEKPSTFVSTYINCGVYVCSLEIFSQMTLVFNLKEQDYFRWVDLYNQLELYFFIFIKMQFQSPFQHSKRFIGQKPGIYAMGEGDSLAPGRNRSTVCLPRDSLVVSDKDCRISNLCQSPLSRTVSQNASRQIKQLWVSTRNKSNELHNFPGCTHPSKGVCPLNSRPGA